MLYRFGGHVNMMDAATGVVLEARVFGSYDAECDETTAQSTIGPAILAAFGALGEQPGAATLFTDPSAFPTRIEPAIRQALAARGLPAVRIGDWNASLSPDSQASLTSMQEALGAAKKSAPGAIAEGANVLVQWSDGNRYPGTVRTVRDGQMEIAFADGQVRWVPAEAVGRG